MHSAPVSEPATTSQGADGPEPIVAIRELFWREGYRRTSVEDIVRTTGLNRYALYSDFGCKRDIFLAALEHYYGERRNIFLSRLGDASAPPLSAIEAVFRFAIAEMSARGSGCLMCNVATEVGHEDPIIRRRIDDYLNEITAAYRDCLDRARERDELRSGVDPGAAARMLVTVKLGLGVQARGGAAEAEMLATFSSVLAMLTADRRKCA